MKSSIRNITAGAGVLTLALPFIASAQQGGQLSNLTGLVVAAGGIINLLIPIMMALAIVVFFWGLVKYILAAKEPEARKEGTNLMVGGIIALFVMVSIYGIIQFVGGSLGIQTNGGGSLNPPTVGNSNNG